MNRTLAKAGDGCNFRFSRTGLPIRRHGRTERLWVDGRPMSTYKYEGQSGFHAHEGRGELELPKMIETDYPDLDETTRSLITINLEAMP
jgi:hypothetical protein